MQSKTWVLCLLLCILCLIPVTMYWQGRYKFNELKMRSLVSFGELPLDAKDPLLAELKFRRQFVTSELQSACYPMPQDPNLIYVLPWCEFDECGLDIVWLGTEAVSGVQIEFIGGKTCEKAFDGEMLESVRRKRGLAKEISLEWLGASCKLDEETIGSIETVRLLGIRETPIGNAVRPRTNQRGR